MAISSRTFFGVLLITLLAMLAILLRIEQVNQMAINRHEAMAQTLRAKPTQETRPQNDKSRSSTKKVETGTFRASFYGEISMATIELRTKLVDMTHSGLSKTSKPVKVLEAEPNKAKAERVVQRLCDIEGVIHIHLSPHSITIMKAGMYTWEELENRIVEILKAEFPDTDPSDSQSKTPDTGTNEQVPKTKPPAPVPQEPIGTQKA